MSRTYKRTTYYGLTLLTTLILAAIAATTVTADPKITAKQLGGTARYLAYASTDKPVYRAGEPVYFRTVILNATDNTPLATRPSDLNIVINGPTGDVIHEGTVTGSPNNAIGYQWTVQPGTPGGLYTAEISSPALGVPVTRRTFEVRAYRLPRINTQIQFTQESYGPGDQVNASVAIERAEGGPPAGAEVVAIARIDGVEVFRSAPQRVADSGLVTTQFSLPAQIPVGEGSLSFVIEDGGVVETASKTLPITLQTLEINFYPEGGDLIAELPGRIYFQALLPTGKPADVKGYIVELQDNLPTGDPIVHFSSQHEGRGRFSFTPKKATHYAAVFSAPSGITSPAKLPKVASTGTVITSHHDSYDWAQKISLSVQSNSTLQPVAKLTLHKRDSLLDSSDVNHQLVALDAKDAEGVLIATAWDAKGKPLAERLVYRHPRFGLNIELSIANESHTPGAEVVVDVKTTNDNGDPVEAVVGLTVTDDSVLELIDKREQAPRLPVMVHLENEVLDLADAHVYLDRAHPDAVRRTDLLLGTQGWRRFVLTDYQSLKQRYPLKAPQILGENIPLPVIEHLMADAMVEKVMLNEAMPMAMAVMEQRAIVPADRFAAEDEAQPNIADRFEEVAIELPLPVAREAVQKKRRAPAEHQDLAAMGAMAIDAMPEPPGKVGYIREFAYQARANRQPNDRVDFTETLYWHSGVQTNARDGRASIRFDLSDSVTTFRVMADAFGRNGAIGSADTTVASVEPFYITAKMPLQVTAGDTITLPVTLVNTTTTELGKTALQVAGEGITSNLTTLPALAAGQRLRNLIDITANRAGTFIVTMKAQAGPYSDSMTRTLTVLPAGFPINVNHGGLLSAASAFQTDIVIPKDVAAGSLVATAKLYPSPLASMEEALNALLREPRGCFEQTSSSNYPLVMAQQYFESHSGIDPTKIATARALLEKGYKKLISFESQDNGYEWFGENPAHEALTAYGLMEFSDMDKVMNVDANMIERTRRWLLDRRDGKGGFKRNSRALDSFGRAPAATTDAYIVWSLLESGQPPLTLEKEIAAVKSRALKGKDSYIDALAANILFIAGDHTGAQAMAEKLVAATDAAGAVSGASTSITRSGGDALTIETTSLALLAWLRDDEHWAARVEHSIKWLFERSKAGRFGSTQSTVLALKAINAYDAARAAPKKPGTVQLHVNGQPFGNPVQFDQHSRGVIELPDFSIALSSTGRHELQLRMTDGSKMPFSLDVAYHSSLPDNANITPISLNTTISHNSIVEGEPLEMNLQVFTAAKPVPTPIAIIGIPAGLTLRHEQLKALVSTAQISAYEIIDSELVLYWRALQAQESRTLTIALTATVPGIYTAPASRIYPYYTDEQKLWRAGHNISIAAR